MFEIFPLWRSTQVAAFALLFTVECVAQSQPLLIRSIPVGQKPLGVAIASRVVGTGSTDNLVAVANSGDNSVSTFGFSFGSINASPTQRLIQGVPSPYAVAVCGVSDASRMVVTSPSNNSVSVINPAEGTLVGTVKVGPQPYSSACGVVSNYGDSSLSVINTTSPTVLKTIPNVPGSRSLHGIAFESFSSVVWVAGTDANMVSRVDINTGQILQTFPVPGPTSVYQKGQSVFVISSTDNTILVFDTTTLTLTQRISVPAPQDFVSTGFGNFAIIGPGRSLAQIGADGVTTIPEVAGPASLAAGIVTSRFQPQEYVLVTSPDSNSVFLVQVQPPQPALPEEFSIRNGASFIRGITAPGSLGSLFATTGVSQNFFANSLPLPKTLGGVTLRFGGTLTFDQTASKWNYSPVGSLEAPLLFVGPNQVNFQIPPGISLGDAVPVQLTKPDGNTLLSTVRITASAPGIFTVLQNGQGQAAVLNQDNSQNFGTRPARRESVIQIFATGAGETDPPLLPGEAAPASGNPLVLTRVQPTVTIGGINARVLFSGMAPGWVGLWQINAEVPASVTPGPAVPLAVSAGGVASNTVTIAVE